MPEEVKGILVYDTQSFPQNAGLTFEEVMDLYQQEKTILYDSSQGGKPPYIINGTDKEIKFIDTNKKEENGE